MRASVTASDGSLYVLADVTGPTAGQTIKGTRDVALMKYDSAGNLVYTRTLGAAQEASGFALSVSADGSKVAIAGSVMGALDYGDAGQDAKTSDSFVTVFDAEGQALWSTRRGGEAAADQVTASPSAPTARSMSPARPTGSVMPGQRPSAGRTPSSARLCACDRAGPAEAYTSNFTVQYGTAGADTPGGMAVNGSSLVVAGTENGKAVLRRYDLQATGAPVLGATRNLGAMQGSLAGVGFAADGSVIVAGHDQQRRPLGRRR